MKVFNVMMCRDLGGIQQAFLDYEKALSLEGHEVINIISTNAAITDFLKQPFVKLPNLTSWCPISKIYFRILVKNYKPDIIIVHGGRASNFATTFKVSSIPVIGITHNYSYRRLRKCDYVIALTQDLRNPLVEGGYPEERIHFLPNMITVDQPYVTKTYHRPLIIGTFGRFVENKGFHHLILAMRQVLDQGLNVKLIIGGSGEEELYLHKLVEDLGLEEVVEFVGWIENKEKFFESIDIFCCPSEHEPFGIVILEAMKYSTPIIATKSQGPSEILKDSEDALLVENRSPEKIALGITNLANDETLAKNLAQKAYIKVKEKYDLKVVAKELSKFLQSIN